MRNANNTEQERTVSPKRKTLAKAGCLLIVCALIFCGCGSQGATGGDNSSAGSSAQTDSAQEGGDSGSRSQNNGDTGSSSQGAGDSGSTVQSMTTDILDIGKADCSVFQCGGDVVVIDTGYDDTFETVENYMSGQSITRIDYLIITHFDKDHVGGAAELLKNYDVGTVYEPDYSADEEDSEPYRKYRERLAENDIEPIVINTDSAEEVCSFTAGDAVFTIYPPQKLEYDKDKDNNRSLAVTVEHGDVNMLFAGDAEKARINELLEQIPGMGEISFDLLKVPHHGHLEKNSDELFDEVSPKYAVICADEDDPDDGPDEEVIDMLKDAGAEVFTTGNGDVHCLSDGEKLSVTQAD